MGPSMGKSIWDSFLGSIEGHYRKYRPRSGIRVYYYHGLVEKKIDYRVERNLHTLDEFAQQVRFLRRYWVLSISDLMEVRATGRYPRDPAVVLTFDDGYVNNLLAAEILVRYKLPWAVFVSTGPVSRGETTWLVELSLLLLRGEAERVEIMGKSWSLRDRQQRESAFQSIRRWLKSQPADARQSLMSELRSQFPEAESDRLLDKFPWLKLMTWDDLSQLSHSGVTIGSHGVEHELHHSVQPESVRVRELAESKAVVEARLGRPCRFFAYPNGDHDSLSPSQLQSAGYELGFTTEQKTVVKGFTSCLLPRLSAPSSLRGFVRNFYWDTRVPDAETIVRASWSESDG